MTDTRYISTSIPYVNADPHVGFALELVQADVLARHARLAGQNVLFQGGTDDNSLKNVRAAEAVGLTPAELVCKNARRFLDLASVLGVGFDEFVSTGTDERHRLAVNRLWNACADKGDLYRRSYEGLYCVGCEQYYTDDELVGGCCPEHGTPPETIREDNWFFRLSKYGPALISLIRSGRLQIKPESKRNEVLSFLEGGLEDLCVSRSAERARGWGIPVPGDSSEVIYVWFDALANYLTGAGYGVDDEGFAERWTKARSKEHVVGKGITRFHAVYWPAILLSAGIALPDRILVHGYLTVDGRKIGKSNGNGVDPFGLVERNGLDAVRWYLLRHIRTTEDADFSETRLVTAHDADLADQLGNLVNRTLAVLAKSGRPLSTYSQTPSAFSELAKRLPGQVDDAVGRFALHEATGAIVAYVAEANRHIVKQAPWTLLKALDDPDTAARFDEVISDLVLGFHTIAYCLRPFLPDAASRLSTILAAAEKGGLESKALFPRIAVRE